MKQSTAILQAAHIMAQVMNEKCDKDIAVFALKYLASESGMTFDELTDSGLIMIEAEIKLNKIENANTK